MKLRLLSLLVSSTYYSRTVYGLNSSCPSDYCGTDIVNTEPTGVSSCPTLSWVTLDTYTYNGEVLIELRGPQSVADAADLVITAPHGGYLWQGNDTYIPDRYEEGPLCPDPCKLKRDSYTLEISEYVQEKFIANYCKVRNGRRPKVRILCDYLTFDSHELGCFVFFAPTIARYRTS